MKNILDAARKLATADKSAERRKKRIAEKVLENVRRETEGISGIVGVEFGGSYPKGTWLPQNADIDVFVKFEPEVSERKFVQVSKKIGFAALKEYSPYVRYSDHPYVEAVAENTKINVVPCYKVRIGMWQSAADRTQFHTEFMKKNLTARMKADVRILKRFLQCARIYGAEISTQGLSGYVAEVLVYNYKSFEGTVRAMAKAGRGHTVGKKTASFQTPIIIMDPIDSKRNLAAAVSAENMGRFVLLCRAFLGRPSVSFFKPHRLSAKSEAFKNCVVVRFVYRDRAPDTVWGQLKRAASSLAHQLDAEGFSVIRHGALEERGKKRGAMLYFMLESAIISQTRARKGPSFFGQADAAAFISKNAAKSLSIWIDSDEGIRVLECRSHTDAADFLKRTLRGGLSKSGVPKGLWPDIRKGFTTAVGAKAAAGISGAALRETVATDAKIFSAR